MISTYLRLQPYTQSTLKGKGAENLKPRFYGPYRIVRKAHEASYELDLPENSKVHNVFQVSCLMKAVGQHVTVSTEFPPLDDEGKLILVPDKIFQTKERKLISRTIKDYLVLWIGIPDEDATW